MSTIDPIQFTKGGEISEDALRQLNELMEIGLGEDASDEEINVFMAKAMQIEGAAEMIQQFSEQMADGGVLAEVLKTEAANEPFAQLSSPARLIYLISKEDRSLRLSLPTDASFYELHAAITIPMLSGSSVILSKIVEYMYSLPRPFCPRLTTCMLSFSASKSGHLGQSHFKCLFGVE